MVRETEPDHPSVFIVDDDPLVIDLIKFRLKRLGYKTDGATDGETALEKLKETPADLLILDYQIPVVRAQELVEALDIPVLMLTVEWREQDVIDILDAGVTDYLTKPFSPDELVKRVQRIVEPA